ncbi:uncharacterized protein LOC114302412 isoform X1 [Camellia sinensis]|uniref:uncharacterized protein LOC114302412 isoform X1 n=1 Tax=Camellia sinensis TaxID=4442 RepID=UPI00103652D3|nr:uncharacterized protein LOC114302412 isoform X1 [Camellia sinensis]XP_028103234.1 uncharacterized protein LOC114302412 isoform X1 [Camellia sinensis]XP_028103235.1 uncharacterized protein LOC114302412 isoform X1 [Camellia sinensis]
MDRMDSEERDLLIDLESGRIISEEGSSQGAVSGNRQVKNAFNTVLSGFLGLNRSVGGESGVNSYSNLGETSKSGAGNVEGLLGSSSGEVSGEHMAIVEKKHGKEKRKNTKYKKAPKPPRPPKGPSLDAADVKLIKELSALAMKKRARSEQMKAMKKMKEAKSSSSSLISKNSSVSALVITILFFVIILFQGFCSRSSSSVSFEGSPEPAATNSLISVQFYGNPSTNFGNGHGSEPPRCVFLYMYLFLHD